MNKKLLYILLFAISTISCEDIEVIQPQGWYEEKIVVYAELKANVPFEGVRFTKTIPLNQEYEITKAELKDVKAYLKVNGVKIIPIHYTEEGMYKSINLFVPEPGDTYELFAINNNKKLYAKTIIPNPPVVSNAVFAGDDFLEATVLSHKEEAYGALWIIRMGNSQIAAEDFYEILNNKSDNPVPLKVRTELIPEIYRSYKSSTYVKIASFDSSFRDYFITRNNNQPINDAFSQSGSPIKWNVTGENVIGLFMGISESDLILAR